MNSQKEIATALKTTQSMVSMMLNPNSDRNITWPLAARIDAILPGKGATHWKTMAKTELKTILYSHEFKNSISQLKGTHSEQQQKEVLSGENYNV